MTGGGRHQPGIGFGHRSTDRRISPAVFTLAVLMLVVVGAASGETITWDLMFALPAGTATAQPIATRCLPEEVLAASRLWAAMSEADWQIKFTAKDVRSASQKMRAQADRLEKYEAAEARWRKAVKACPQVMPKKVGQ